MFLWRDNKKTYLYIALIKIAKSGSRELTVPDKDFNQKLLIFLCFSMKTHVEARLMSSHNIRFVEK